MQAPRLSFTEDELEVLEHISAAYRGIRKLGLRQDTANLGTELCAATHSMQFFVMKHALERIGFDGVTIWFNNKEDTMSDAQEPAQEREHMEDTRPAEPGTVGDTAAEALADPGPDPDKPAPEDPGPELDQPDDESGREE